MPTSCTGALNLKASSCVAILSCSALQANIPVRAGALSLKALLGSPLPALYVSEWPSSRSQSDPLKQCHPASVQPWPEFGGQVQDHISSLPEGPQSYLPVTEPVTQVSAY